MSWEESSTKCKNYYGVVEEPREERIIPIKIDRGISIHTASDEEEEPFWVIENVKKREELRNEIKNMKENKNSEESLADNYFEDEDSLLNDLLRRGRKQRNELENILEKENNKNNVFEMNCAEEIVLQNNSRLSESYTLKEKLVSTLSSLEEDIDMNKISENTLNESISRNSNAHIKHKKGYSSVTENISNKLMYSTTENVITSEKGYITNQSSTDMVENCSSFKIENLNTQNSKYEDGTLNTVKKASISTSSSKEEECNNTSLPQKTINEYSKKQKKGSLSRLSSIEEHNNSSVPSKIIFNEYSDRSKRASLSSTEDSSQDFTSNKTTSYDTKLEESNTEFIENDSISKPFSLDNHKKKCFEINNTLNNEPKIIEVQNLNDSNNTPNFTKNEFNYDSNMAKTYSNDNLNKSNDINMSTIDEADSRRKSLIKQSSVLSDALNAMCSEIPENTTYNKLKRLSIKEDKFNDNFNDCNLKETTKNDLLKTLIKKSNSIKSSSFDEDKADDSSKSNISKITNNKNSIDLENEENKLKSKLNNKIDVSDINNVIRDVHGKSKSLEISNPEIPSNIDTNHQKLDDFENNDITSKKPDSDIERILDTNAHTSNNQANESNTSNNVNASNKILNHRELHSTPNSLQKDNKMDVLFKESISICDINSKSGDEGLHSNNSTNDLLSSKEKKDIDNQEMSFKDHLVNKENERNSTEPIIEETNIKALEQPSEDIINNENKKTLKLKKMDTTIEENTNKSISGIKKIGGIPNFRCNNNVSVVFFLFVRKSSLFRLLKLHIILVNIPAIPIIVLVLVQHIISHVYLI